MRFSFEVVSERNLSGSDLYQLIFLMSINCLNTQKQVSKNNFCVDLVCKDLGKISDIEIRSDLLLI